MTDTTADPSDPSDDGVEITGTGLVHLRLDGVDYWLRRPKIGEMKRLEELIVGAAKLQTDRITRLADKVQEATAAAEAANAEHGGDDAAVASEVGPNAAAVVEAAEAAEADMAAIEQALLSAWREVVQTLERDGKTLPDDDDDLPPWLANFDLFGAVRKAWRRLPWLAAPRQ